MSSLNPFWKEQRRLSIIRAASAILKGNTIQATDRNAIKAIILEYPARFESVVKLYGSDMVVQIISSLLENGTFALESNAQLESAKTHQPSALRDRQHDALEQEAAQSEAMALDEASRSDLAMLEGDLGGEHVDVAGYSFCHAIIVDSANAYEKKSDRSKTPPGPFPPNRHLSFPRTCRIFLSISC